MKKQLHLKKATVFTKSAKLILLIVMLSFYGTSIVKACCTTPTVDFTASSFTVTTGQSLNFTDLSTGPVGDPPNKWKWVFTGGSPATDTINQNPSGVTFTLTPATACDHIYTQVKLTASNGCGAGTPKSYNIVVVSNKPESDFTASTTTPTSGATVTFTDLSTQSPHTGYSWSITPGVVNVDWQYMVGNNTSQNPQVKFNTVGLYSITHNASNTNGAGCAKTKTNYINCISNKSVSNFTSNVTTIAAGGTVNFTDLSTLSPTSWAWTVSPSAGVSYQGGTNASMQNPQIKFNNPGCYAITLNAQNSNGGFPKTVACYVTVTAVYNWTGGGGAGNQNWNYTSGGLYPNWSPNTGYPGMSPTDEAVITGGVNNPVLNLDLTIQKLTIANHTLTNSLQYTLRVNGDADVGTGGATSLLASSTNSYLRVGGTLTLKNTTILSGTSRNYYFTATDLIVNSACSIFGNAVTFTKTGGVDNNWYGNNYNPSTNLTFIDSSDADINMSCSVADNYNTGTVIFKIAGAGSIYPDYGFGVTFDRGFTMEGSGSGGVYIGETGKSSNVAGSYNVDITPANFTEGVLSFKNFTANVGVGWALDPDPDGDALIVFGSGCTFNNTWLSTGVKAPNIQFNGTNFTATGSVTFEVTKGNNSDGTGGNTFGGVGATGTFTFLNQSDGGNLTLGNTAADTYNAIARFTAKGFVNATYDNSYAYISICNGYGSVFNNGLIINSQEDHTGSGCCAWFNDPSGVDLVGGTDSRASLVNAANNKTFTFGTVNDGYVTIKNMNINGTNAQTLDADNGQLQNWIYPTILIENTTWAANLTFDCPDGRVKNSVFNNSNTTTGTFRLTCPQTAGTSVYFSGNTFKGAAQFVNSTTTNFFCCTGYKWATDVHLSNPSVDDFQYTTLFQANGAEPWVSNDNILTHFKGNITIDVSGAWAGVQMKGEADAGVTTSVTGFAGGSEQCWGADNGWITFSNFTNNGNAMTISGTGNNYLYINASTFNSDVTFSAQSLEVKNSTFGGITTITKTGSSSLCGTSNCYGGNTFNNRVIFTNACAAGKNLRLASTAADIYNDLSTFTKNGAGLIEPAATGINLFKKNITINGTSATATTFGANGGTVKLCGNNAQISINVAGSALPPIFYNLEIDN